MSCCMAGGIWHYRCIIVDGKGIYCLWYPNRFSYWAKEMSGTCHMIRTMALSYKVGGEVLENAVKIKQDAFLSTVTQNLSCRWLQKDAFLWRSKFCSPSLPCSLLWLFSVKHTFEMSETYCEVKYIQIAYHWGNTKRAVMAFSSQMEINSKRCDRLGSDIHSSNHMGHPGTSLSQFPLVCLCSVAYTACFPLTENG